jgi:MATE family multidrug resistance protein
MTSTKILPGHAMRASWLREARAVGGISAAVTMTMFAQLAISAIETLIVARLGTRALAGVTLAISVDSLVFMFALGVTTAITPIVSEAFGRGDALAVRVSGQQGIWVGLSFALPGVAVLLACRWLLRGVIGPGGCGAWPSPPGRCESPR